MSIEYIGWDPQNYPYLTVPKPIPVQAYEHNKQIQIQWYTIITIPVTITQEEGHSYPLATVTSPKDPFFVSNAKPSLDSILENVLSDKVLSFKEQELIERKDEARFPPTFVNVKSKKTKKKPITEPFHQDAKQIMKDGMKIPFVATFPTGFQRKTSVRNNIPEERESYIDEKIKV